jgi:hypothetical protein
MNDEYRKVIENHPSQLVKISETYNDTDLLQKMFNKDDEGLKNILETGESDRYKSETTNPWAPTPAHQRAESSDSGNSHRFVFGKKQKKSIPAHSLQSRFEKVGDLGEKVFFETLTQEEEINGQIEDDDMQKLERL